VHLIVCVWGRYSLRYYLATLPASTIFAWRARYAAPPFLLCVLQAEGAALGMLYLHSCNPPVLHRDLKSPNLLLGDNWTIKVNACRAISGVIPPKKISSLWATCLGAQRAIYASLS
jgi:hypothetical protein